MAGSSMVFVGMYGSVIALDRSSGTMVWSTGLKGSDFVNVFLSGDELFAGTKGELYCLDMATGQILWHNPLKGYGRGLITIALDPGVSNQTSVMREKRRREEAAAAGAAAAGAAAS